MNDTRLARTINRKDIAPIAREILARCANGMDMEATAHKFVIDAEHVLNDYVNGCFGYIETVESFDFLLRVIWSAAHKHPGVESIVTAHDAVSAVRTMVAITNN